MNGDGGCGRQQPTRSRNRSMMLQLLRSLLSFSAANKYISSLILICQYRVGSPGDKSCVLLVVKITDAVESTWEPISRQHPPIIAVNDNTQLFGTPMPFARISNVSKIFFCFYRSTLC